VENILDKLNPAEIAALLGAFVCQSRGFKDDDQSGIDAFE